MQCEYLLLKLNFLKQTMKSGHFIAIILFCLIILFCVLFYFDVQDRNFSSKLLFAPIFFTYLLILFLIFPGSKLDADKNVNFLENLSPNNFKAIIIGFAVTLYIYFWTESLFTGENFFAIDHQVSLALAFIIIFLIIKWQFNKQKNKF